MCIKTQYHRNSILQNSIALYVEASTEGDIVQEEILKDINLYHQPLQVPWIAVTFFILRLTLLVAAEYLQFKVYNLMKKEKGLVKNVTQLFVLTQMTFWPFWLQKCKAKKVAVIKFLADKWREESRCSTVTAPCVVVTLHSVPSPCNIALCIISL